MKQFTTVLGMTLLMAGGIGRAEDDKASTPKLAGGYTLVSGERGGKKLGKEKIEDHTVRFSNDQIVVIDKEKKEVYVARYKLDASGKTCKITMTSEVAPNKGKTVEGLIEKKGDTVRLIYALEGDAPTEFKTKNDKQIMVTMKNRKK